MAKIEVVIQDDLLPTLARVQKRIGADALSQWRNNRLAELRDNFKLQDREDLTRKLAEVTLTDEARAQILDILNKTQ